MLFSVKDILLSRGFEMISENSNESTLVSGINLDDERYYNLIELQFKIFHSTLLRKELLKFIEHKVQPSSKLVKELINSTYFKSERHLFSNTFEWFIGELMVRKFKAFSYSFGATIDEILRNSDDGNSGDYDTLVVQRNTNLVYFECKTGKFDRRAIIKSIERSISLHTEFLVFFIMDNINESQLSDCLIKADYPNYNTPKLLKLNIKSSDVFIYKWHNCYFVSADDFIEEQLSTVLRINQARKIIKFYDSDIDNDLYSKIGYHVEEI